jgi:hypothetical protein
MLTDRIVALFVLIVATLAPIRFLGFVVIPEMQLILGTLVVLYLLIRDPLSGLLLGVALLLMYFRVFAAKYGFTWKNIIKPLSKKSAHQYPMVPSLVSDYITPDHLRSAQNNIVDDKDYQIEVKGIDGIYGETVYGAQGMDPTMPGFGEVPMGGEVRTL